MYFKNPRNVIFFAIAIFLLLQIIAISTDNWIVGDKIAKYKIGLLDYCMINECGCSRALFTKSGGDTHKAIMYLISLPFILAVGSVGLFLADKKNIAIALLGLAVLLSIVILFLINNIVHDVQKSQVGMLLFKEPRLGYTWYVYLASVIYMIPFIIYALRAENL